MRTAGKVIIALVALALLLVAYSSFVRHKSQSQMVDLLRGSGDENIRSIKFVGQGKTYFVDDIESVGYMTKVFGAAVQSPREDNLRSSYYAYIVTKRGAAIDIAFNFNSAGTAMHILYPIDSFSDPKTYKIELISPVPPLLHDIFIALD